MDSLLASKPLRCTIMGIREIIESVLKSLRVSSPYSEIQIVVDLFALIFAILLTYSILDTDITLCDQFIPTTLNGVTSCTSLIVGFTATAVAVTVSQFKNPRDAPRITITILFLSVSIVLLFYAYAAIMDKQYHLALKSGMIALVVSISTLIDLVFFFALKLRRFEETSRSLSN